MHDHRESPTHRHARGPEPADLEADDREPLFLDEPEDVRPAPAGSERSPFDEFADEDAPQPWGSFEADDAPPVRAPALLEERRAVVQVSGPEPARTAAPSPRRLGARLAALFCLIAALTAILTVRAFQTQALDAAALRHLLGY